MRSPQHDAQVGLRPSGLHAKGHAGTDAARPVISTQPNTKLRLDNGLHVAIRCIYAQSLQVNPANPAVCHGTLRLPLGGVTVTYLDPTQTLCPYTWSHSHLKEVFPKYLENTDYGRKK